MAYKSCLNAMVPAIKKLCNSKFHSTNRKFAYKSFLIVELVVLLCAPDCCILFRHVHDLFGVLSIQSGKKWCIGALWRRFPCQDTVSCIDFTNTKIQQFLFFPLTCLRKMEIGNRIVYLEPQQTNHWGTSRLHFLYQTSVAAWIHFQHQLQTHHLSHRGSYSVEHLEAFDDYRHQTSFVWVLLVCVVLPWSTFLVSSLVELIPLQNPADGLKANNPSAGFCRGTRRLDQRQLQ